MTAALAAKSGQAPEVMVKNIADFERSYADYDLATRMKEAVEFKADLVILAIGENVPALATAEDGAKFEASVTKLIETLTGERKPTLLVRSGFWGTRKGQGAAPGLRLRGRNLCVDISGLGKVEANYARSERPYKTRRRRQPPGRPWHGRHRRRDREGAGEVTRPHRDPVSK